MRQKGFIRVVVAAIGVVFAVSVWPLTAQAATCRIAPATGPVQVGTTGRSSLVHFPKGFDPAVPAPVVFLLHGSNGSGAGMFKASGLTDTADRHGFIVVAPDGGIATDTGFVWNIPGVPTVTGKVPDAKDADDVAFIGAAIDWLVAEGCADGARVYATGFSGGGRMTSWLGCVAADRFAAIAPVVGLRAGNPRKDAPQSPDPETCRPSRPVPVIAFAGDKDGTNPIQGGGAGYWQYSLHAAEQRWAQLNRCTAAPTTRWVAPGIYEERYSTCASDADVVGRVTVGGGHVWLADGEAMWAFFARYRRTP